MFRKDVVACVDIIRNSRILRIHVGYHELDLKNRLLLFAKVMADDYSSPRGIQEPSTALDAGSYVPNHSNCMLDNTTAKISACSFEDLTKFRHCWGQMYLQNREQMQAKLLAGRVGRNQYLHDDNATATAWRRNKSGIVRFCNCMLIGAGFSTWIPSAVCSGKEGLSRSCFEEPISEASFCQQKTNSNFFWKLASGTWQYKALSSTAAPAPLIILHTYSVGLESLLEGMPLKKLAQERARKNH
jgi:hypothetical protein